MIYLLLFFKEAGKIDRFKIFIKKSSIPFFLLLTTAIIVSLMYHMRKNITLVIGNEKQMIYTYKDTVKSALENNKIKLYKKDKIYPSLSSDIKSGETIRIKRAVNVNVIADGKVLSFQSAEKDINSLLKAENIVINDKDKTQPSLTSSLKDGMKIIITRVTNKDFKMSSPIAFNTVIKYDSSIANTQKKVLAEGKLGEKMTTTNVVYEDGKEVSRKIVAEAVVSSPVNKVIVQGTYPVMPVSRGGDMLPYASVIKVRATAYYATSGIGKTYTFSGRKAVRDPNGYSTIAVDPRVIPLGTKVFVENYGYAIAAETGSAIIGNTIDVFFDTYAESCKWAVKYVNVYILK